MTPHLKPARIAISGTHCCGKSTLINQFLLAHPDFAHEPEPYYALLEDYGEVFPAELSADDFYRQLEFNLSRSQCYKPGEQVIYERSPADFLAYLLAIDNLGRSTNASPLIDRSIAIVREAIQFLDLIVFLPLDEDDNGVAESEDQELRTEVDRQLTSILIEDDFDLFTLNQPVILEAAGSTVKRLKRLEMLCHLIIWTLVLLQETFTPLAL